jgi:hypothetical protein
MTPEAMLAERLPAASLERRQREAVGPPVPQHRAWVVVSTFGAELATAASPREAVERALALHWRR